MAMANIRFDFDLARKQQDAVGKEKTTEKNINWDVDGLFLFLVEEVAKEQAFVSIRGGLTKEQKFDKIASTLSANKAFELYLPIKGSSLKRKYDRESKRIVDHYVSEKANLSGI